MPPTARAAGTPAAPVITWARTFPAVPAQVREARRFLAGLLAGQLNPGPATDDAVLCLSELASNAVVHSRSGQPGGQFTVRIRLHGPDLRVEVADAGGPWGSPTPNDQHGRGLTAVSAIARAWGVIDGTSGGRVVWFELPTVQPIAVPSASIKEPACRFGGVGMPAPATDRPGGTRDT